MQDSKCRICRRLGVKLFLKGEKCLSPKCPMVRRPYPPGQKRKRRLRALSEYGKELREKQRLKNWYNLEERQFKRYIKETLESRGKIEDAATFLIQKLESRLDNVIFRLGFASSRAQARQLVSHSHFLINGKPVNIPSFQLKKGDKITLRQTSRKRLTFKNLRAKLKKYQPPSWLSLNIKTLTGKVTAVPSLEEAVPPVEIPTIFEFYSR
ncbi:30S ribosomal protein S4 [Patescibacteria group bacterium]|nr:30S ribosomal protein S4 [Patescibacteria group bacterium]